MTPEKLAQRLASALDARDQANKALRRAWRDTDSDDDASESLRLDVAIEIRPRSRLGLVNPQRDRWLEVAVLDTDSVRLDRIDSSSLAFGPSAVAPLRGGVWRALGRFGGRRSSRGRGPELRLRVPVVPADYAPGEIERCLTGMLADDPFVACDSLHVQEASCEAGGGKIRRFSRSAEAALPVCSEAGAGVP